jgi:putative ABC transport system permease protein
MPGLLQNLSFGWRLLRKSPGFTLVAVITLALGVGANTAIFSVVYATLLAPMPYPKPDQLVMVWSKVRGFRNGLAAGDFLDWKRQNTSFQDLNAWTGGSFNLATKERPEQVQGQLTTPGFYSMMGVNFSLGRDFLPEEGQVGKDHEVVLMNRLWQRLGSDKDIVGKQLRVNGESYTVVGVIAPGPTDRLQTEMVAPLAFKPEQINHDFHWILAMGRLKDGVSIAAAQADMDVVTARIAKDYPQSNKGWGASVEPLKNDFFPKEQQRTLWLLMGAVGFVLLIACANVANLLLAKATTRMKEVALRSSLGATRWRVFSQFLTESLVLAFLGGAAGIGLSEALLKLIMAMMPPFTLPSEADVRLSLPVLFFTLASTMLAGILFGCAPAWKASGVSLNETLKEGGRSGTGRDRHRLRRVLVVAEFGLALTLLGGAGLAMRSFWNLTKVDLGVRPDHVLSFSLPVPDKRFSKPEEMVTFYRQLVEKLQAIPGVSHVSMANGLPTQGTGMGMPFNLAGHPAKEAGSRDGAGFQMVTPYYFQTFGIQLMKGRSFNEHDVDGTPRVAMVNENFVRRYLSGIEPIGQRILIEQLVPGVAKLGPEQDWEIVGVFHNVRNGLRNEDGAEIDVPFYQSPWPSMNAAVRTSGNPFEVRKSVAAAVSSMDPDLALADVKSMDQVVDESFVGDRFVTMLYGAFAVVALLLAAVGIYGVMAFSVAQRTHEIGLRMALGANRGEVIGLVLKEGILLAVIGSAIGLLGACFVGRAMQGVLFGVGTVDFVAFTIVSLTLLISALIACYLPAQRAANVDPMVALRYE